MLASGGTDSTALMHFYKKRNENVECLFIDYGQPSLKSERKSLIYFCNLYEYQYKVIQLGFEINSFNGGSYNCRNILFVLSAAGMINQTPARIALGIHSGTEHFDCSKSFINTTQQLLDGYFSGMVQLETPFLDFTKKDIYDYCFKQRINIAKTNSCELANSNCGQCMSCLDREMLCVL